MLSIFLTIAFSLTNYQYSRVEMVKMCVSEKSESSFCKEKIESLKKSQVALEDLKIKEE